MQHNAPDPQGLRRLEIQDGHHAIHPTAAPEPPSAVRAEACPVCGGVGWFCYAVPRDDPRFGVLQPCACQQSARVTARRARVTELSELQWLVGCTFKTFDPWRPGVGAAYRVAWQFAEQPTGFLTLHGACGCGKTHLAAAIAWHVWAQHPDVLFIVVPSLLNRLRRTFRPGSDAVGLHDHLLDVIRNITLLVLDDLGTEQATPWAREQLFEIVNYRARRQLATVVTTNLSLDMLDPRIESRLHGAGPVLTLRAEDYRKRQR